MTVPVSNNKTPRRVPSINKALLSSQSSKKLPLNIRLFVVVSLMAFLFRSQPPTSSTYSVQVTEKEKRGLPSQSSSPKKAVVGPCPPPDPTVDQLFAGFPQNLTFGDYRSEKGEPFITQDFWADIVDNRRTFLLRPSDNGKPSAERIRDWIRSRPHPIALVISNQVDVSWPPYLSGKRKYEYYLNETKLHAVYAGNSRHLPQYPKLQPIPIGLKFATYSTKLFGDSKENRTQMFTRYGASSPAESEGLFHLQNRTSTVYWRRMTKASNLKTRKYIRDTPALQIARKHIPAIVNETAKHSMVFAPETGRHMPIEDYFGALKTHRFVISPPGNGLDTHATWEALLCGCIPIVPHSPLDPLFEDLPVWLVNSWKEVTDLSVKQKIKYFTDKGKTSTYNWEKLYRSYWEERIYDGLCTV